MARLPELAGTDLIRQALGLKRSMRTERVTDRTIGNRLRIARKTAELTQAKAAAAIDVARTTLVAIEQGKRRVRTHELQALAICYGTSANAILRREAVHIDLVPQFRSMARCPDDGTEQAARLLTDLVSAEAELENALGVARHRNFPRARPLLPGNVRSQAEHDAQELRVWLGLGAGPVRDIVSVMELDLGIRVYVRPVGSRISGLFAQDDAVGACVLLNANHPASRRAYTAAHELGHFTSTRHEPNVLRRDDSPHSREERYADHFARAFLTPARAVKLRFEELTAGHSHLTRRHVVLLADRFAVSREAMVRRLEELGLARRGTWDWFQSHGGITDRQAEQVLGRSHHRTENPTSRSDHVPRRLALLVREAWKKGYYSEGQLARMLRLHRLEVRDLLEGAETERSEADDIVKLPE